MKTLSEEEILRKTKACCLVWDWLSKNKEKAEILDVFFTVFFTGKSAFAEKSLHVLMGKLNSSQQFILLFHM